LSARTACSIVSEDGVLTEWFRTPVAGDRHRLINLVVILQLVTILLSRGDVYVLGEAYAFGVIWSFAFNAVSVLILRYKRPDAPRPWRVPGNIRVAGREIPIGLIGIALILFGCAVVNLFTKQVATIAGVTFTFAFFVVFAVSERITARKGGYSVCSISFSSTRPTSPPIHWGRRPGGVAVSRPRLQHRCTH
jgi:amino acid transporter